MFEADFGRDSGYNQVAPGRRARAVRNPGQPGRPPQSPIQQAIAAPNYEFHQQPAPQQPPAGGGARLYEMPGTGRSGGVGDAAQMLADATVQNNRLKDIGNRRSQLDIFDRSGHEALDREESEIFGSPRSSYANPSGGEATMPQSPLAKSLPDFSKLGAFSNQMGAWSTDAANPSEKFARPWDERSERYKMLSVLSHFDPTKGLNFKNEQLGMTPIEALNQASINGAQFSAAGDDKLDARNLSAWRNYDGTEGIGDIIKGFKTGKGTWGGWGPESKGAPAAAGAPLGVPSGINSLLPAILGQAPVDGGPSEGDRLRKMIMDALNVSPQISALSQMFR
jgi:hypothetical protein